ncbi:hypothetical protein F5Y09DRAFT_296887 [Xylaria sp. FL1042]|nr:hypothetical protein F5Y09DRAFT_296887 [Xylaria sp. FL1042]
MQAACQTMTVHADAYTLRNVTLHKCTNAPVLGPGGQYSNVIFVPLKKRHPSRHT